MQINPRSQWQDWQDLKNNSNSERVTQSTQRLDGSWRPEIRIRPGYISPEEIPKYVTPNKLKNKPINPEFSPHAYSFHPPHKNTSIQELSSRFAAASLTSSRYSFHNHQNSQDMNTRNYSSPPLSYQHLTSNNNQFHNIQKSSNFFEKISLGLSQIIAANQKNVKYVPPAQLNVYIKSIRSCIETKNFNLASQKCFELMKILIYNINLQNKQSPSRSRLRSPLIIS